MQLRRHEARCLVYTLPPAEPEQVPSKANRNGEERGGDTSASVAAYASMWSAGHSLLSYWALGLRILVPQTRNDADMSPCVPRHYIVLDHLSGTAYASCLRVWIAAPLYRWLRPPCYERSVSPVSAYRLAPLRPPCRRVKSQICRFTGLAGRWAYYLLPTELLTVLSQPGGRPTIGNARCKVVALSCRPKLSPLWTSRAIGCRVLAPLCSAPSIRQRPVVACRLSVFVSFASVLSSPRHVVPETSQVRNGPQVVNANAPRARCSRRRCGDR